METVLIIEDDPNLISLIKQRFKQEINIEFFYATSYAEGMSNIAQRSFDLYIIDINLGPYSGFDILKVLQKEKSIDNRVIVMSQDGELESRIEAYNLGASNFILKPLEFDLLRAMLRKNIRSLESRNTGELKFPNMIISLNKRSCYMLEGDQRKEVHLTPIEFNILYKLARSPNIIISKEELSFLGKDQNDSMSFKSLEMHIASIRKKIKEDIIKTKRGIGYYFHE